MEQNRCRMLLLKNDENKPFPGLFMIIFKEFSHYENENRERR